MKFTSSQLKNAEIETIAERMAEAFINLNDRAKLAGGRAAAIDAPGAASGYFVVGENVPRTAQVYLAAKFGLPTESVQWEDITGALLRASIIRCAKYYIANACATRAVAADVASARRGGL